MHTSRMPPVTLDIQAVDCHAESIRIAPLFKANAENFNKTQAFIA